MIVADITEKKQSSMIKEFQNLSQEERELLFSAPVLVSVLAACSYNTINQTQKRYAIKLAHLRTFTAPPALVPYYQEVEKIFEQKFGEIANDYFPFDDEKRAALVAEIDRVNRLLEKLEPDFARTLHDSLDGYSRHVKKSVFSVFTDFIFPMGFSRLRR